MITVSCNIFCHIGLFYILYTIILENVVTIRLYFLKLLT